MLGVSKTLTGDPQGKNHFHSNTKLLAIFTWLVLALMMQEQQWVRLLAPSGNQGVAPNCTGSPACVSARIHAQGKNEGRKEGRGNKGQFHLEISLVKQ